MWVNSEFFTPFNFLLSLSLYIYIYIYIFLSTLTLTIKNQNLIKKPFMLNIENARFNEVHDLFIYFVLEARH